MVIDIKKTFSESLYTIHLLQYHSMIVHQKEALRTDETLQVYGQAKWAIVDLLNEQYSTILTSKFDLYNWLHENQEDEVSYFLNEAGSNCLCYSEFKAPSQFHLWLGKKGFIIGIEQQGKGFNAQEVEERKIKNNKGAAFIFFRRCRGRIFFDNPQDTKIVYLEVKFRELHRKQ